MQETVFEKVFNKTARNQNTHLHYNKTKDKIEDKIIKKNKSKFQELVNPIILLECPEKKDLKPSKDIDNTCHNTPSNSTSGKYMIKIPRYDSGMPEEWIIFVDLVQKVLVG